MYWLYSSHLSLCLKGSTDEKSLLSRAAHLLTGALSPGLRSCQNPLPCHIHSFIHCFKHLLSTCVPHAQVLYPTLWSSNFLIYRVATVILLYPLLQTQQPNSFISRSSLDVTSQSITTFVFLLC